MTRVRSMQVGMLIHGTESKLNVLVNYVFSNVNGIRNLFSVLFIGFCVHALTSYNLNELEKVNLDFRDFRRVRSYESCWNYMLSFHRTWTKV